MLHRRGVRDSDEFGDPASVPLPSTLAKLSAVLERLAEPERAVLHVRNAEFTVLLDHHSNHRLGWPIELFREIARIAQGSLPAGVASCVAEATAVFSAGRGLW
jgi:hypothetical protein